MGSNFDALRDTTFDTTKNVFGYPCEWTSRDGVETYSGLVHFKNPTEEIRLTGAMYDGKDWLMEYKVGDFDGLFEKVEKSPNDPPEQVNIDGSFYYVTGIVSVHDGATFRANLSPINPDTDEPVQPIV